MGSSLRLPTVRLTQCSSITSSLTKFKGIKTASLLTKRLLNTHLKGICSITVAFPTSTSPVATGSLAWPSGSNSTTTVPHPALWTLTVPIQCCTLPTYTHNLTTNTMRKAKPSPHSLCQHGSASSWWVHQLTSPCSITPALIMMTGDSLARSTDTTTLTANLLTPALNWSSCRSSSMASNKLTPPASLDSSLCGLPSRLRNSRIYHISPRPRKECGSISLLDV